MFAVTDDLPLVADWVMRETNKTDKTGIQWTLTHILLRTSADGLRYLVIRATKDRTTN
ncbi:hypothetical protein DPMN_102245 [Dreissena polymorpha]|uniref:Uncharacterized protein n=1 Tax=Dreissena polymorpha TaxID=45954 RepID=A0A9D4LK58_DREPO|nr:hypothetical protein DPMN_102245 [Dreissena polymorpha]